MKKASAIILIGLLTLSTALCGCKKNNGKANVPTFPKSEGVRFSAYAAPTDQGRVTEDLDDAYKKMSEAGFNKVFALYEGNSTAQGADVYETIALRSETAEKTALTALDLCQKYNMKYWVRDWSFYGLTTLFPGQIDTDDQIKKVVTKMFDGNNKYINHPAYGGNFCHDEPSALEMDNIALQIKYYNEMIKKNSKVGGEAYINLLPSYANSITSLGCDSYSEYIDYYMQTIAPLTGYISYDFYPFRNANSINYVRDQYYNNLALVAKKCKEKNVELRTFIQAKGDFTGMRPLTGIADLRFEIYSNLAFGSREIIYYTYSSACNETNPTSDDGYSLYDYKTGAYTWEYDAAKIVNNEIHDMEDAYMAYDWKGCMYKLADEMIENPLLANIADTMKKTKRMRIVSCTNDVLAGVFTAKDEKFSCKDAYMFVNATEPSEGKTAEVTVKFEDTSHLLMYRYGKQIVVPVAGDGTYTFNLQAGEGRFVIPIK
ncbi:MAG: hypothetical protein MJ132_03905 [Clostridia bacterium]|nr:hypothetical protein [Clostridia bacterium]